jgi:tetratricopeptide (TPR) repeat protein
MAIKWFLEGYAKNQFYYAIPCGLALAYNKIGKFDEAIDWSRKSMNLNPLHHEPYHSLGDAFRGKGLLA